MQGNEHYRSKWNWWLQDNKARKKSQFWLQKLARTWMRCYEQSLGVNISGIEGTVAFSGHSRWDQCFSKCAPGTSIISIIRDLVRNTNSMTQLKTNWVRTSTGSPPILCSDSWLSWDQDCQTYGIFSLLLSYCFSLKIKTMSREGEEKYQEIF